MRKVFALDIGGTHVKYAAIDESGALSHEGSIQTLAREGGERLLTRIAALISDNAPDMCHGVAISTAGQVNPIDGSIRYATDNLPGWTGIRLRDRIETATGFTCTVENDVNAAALGESWLGAAKGGQSVLMLALGTGIGGAIIADGRLFSGSHGSAGEVGHICLYPNGHACTCGQKGCFEQYASTRALERLLAAKLNKHTGGARGAFERMTAGDSAAGAVIDEWMRDLALGIATLVPVIDPDIIVLGGAISAQGDALTRPLEALVRARVMPSFRDLRILPAALGNHAGLLGAARCFFLKQAP